MCVLFPVPVKTKSKTWSHITPLFSLHVFNKYKNQAFEQQFYPSGSIYNFCTVTARIQWLRTPFLFHLYLFVINLSWIWFGLARLSFHLSQLRRNTRTGRDGHPPTHCWRHATSHHQCSCNPPFFSYLPFLGSPRGFSCVFLCALVLFRQYNHKGSLLYIRMHCYSLSGRRKAQTAYVTAVRQHEWIYWSCR